MSSAIATTSSNGGTGTRYIDINGDALEQVGWTDCPGCGEPICDAIYHTAKCRDDHRAAVVAPKPQSKPVRHTRWINGYYRPECPSCGNRFGVDADASGCDVCRNASTIGIETHYEKNGPWSHYYAVVDRSTGETLASDIYDARLALDVADLARRKRDSQSS
jgi:hypothetical protein